MSLTIILTKGYVDDMNTSRALIFTLATAFALSGCATTVTPAETTTPDPAPSASAVPAGPSLNIVVTTTVLGSVVKDIATCAVGDDFDVTVLMPIGVDPHDFQASSEQVARMVAADLVVTNGLGLEEGLLAAIDTVAADGGNVMEIGPLIDPLPFGSSDGDDHAGEDDHGHAGGFDPHFWFDMDRMATAATLIGIQLDAAGGSGYSACGATVAAEIDQANSAIETILDSVPVTSRVLVTDHDALSYFAERYDYRIVGVVIPGGSTLGAPNSRELAALVSVIQQENVPAIFGDSAFAPDVLEVLAAEAGRGVGVVPLYIGSIGGPGSGAETYRDMMTTNAERIAEALGS